MYYYLDEHKKVQGPFPAAEMIRMLEAGAIDVQTPASAEGGSGWRPLEELELVEDADPPVPGAAEPELGGCPHCGTMLKGDEVPPECPHCTKALHPGTSNPWKNAWYVCRQFVNFRGRATRREFWCFILFFFLVWYGLDFLRRALEGGMQDAVETLQMLFSLAMVLPGLAVTVRRLHDTDRSGWWAALPFATWLMILPGALLVDVASETVVEGAAMFIVLASMASHLYILILMFRDSEPEANAYGPSLLYPHS